MGLLAWLEKRTPYLHTPGECPHIGELPAFSTFGMKGGYTYYYTTLGGDDACNVVCNTCGFSLDDHEITALGISGWPPHPGPAD